MSPRGVSVLKTVLTNLKCRKPNMPFYAVARGREVGVFQSWSVCQDLTNNYKGAKYKKFDDRESAWDFVKQFRYKSLKPSDESVSDSPPAKQTKMDDEDTSSSRFDFAAFNLRLTNLENTYQEKIRSLEERLSALENEKAGGISKAETIKKAPADSNDKLSKSKGSTTNATKRKLLDSIGEIVKPGSSRPYSTSALKRLRSNDEDCEDSNSIVTEMQESATSSIPFKVDADDYVVVYTDGACPNNGNRSTKAGIGVWFNDGHPLNVSAPVKGRVTNIAAEMEAATVAAQVAAAAGIGKLCIMTDSQFTINCMTTWISNWKKNNWKTSKGEGVAVKAEVLELEKACEELGAIKWVHVKGHAGHYGNERADELARYGADQCL